MSIAHSTGRARSGEDSIFYRKLGNRALTPILIVHGLSYFSWDWLEVGQVLAAEREVVAMDMRGFGDSDRSPQKDYSVPTMAQDIVNVPDHLGWKRAMPPGHFMSRRSITYVAAPHPVRVATVALPAPLHARHALRSLRRRDGAENAGRQPAPAARRGRGGPQHRRREPAGVHRRLAAVPCRPRGEEPCTREALTTWRSSPTTCPRRWTSTRG